MTLAPANYSWDELQKKALIYERQAEEARTPLEKDHWRRIAEHLRELARAAYDDDEVN